MSYIVNSFLTGWAEKWMSRGILSAFIDKEGGELNYIQFKIYSDGVFHCILSCSGLSEISIEQETAIANEIEWKLDDMEDELRDIGIEISEISDIVINICED